MGRRQAGARASARRADWDVGRGRAGGELSRGHRAGWVQQSLPIPSPTARLRGVGRRLMRPRAGQSPGGWRRTRESGVLGAGAVPPGAHREAPWWHLAERPRPRGLPG